MYVVLFQGIPGDVDAGIGDESWAEDEEEDRKPDKRISSK